jgi:hypothetical protein
MLRLALKRVRRQFGLIFCINLVWESEQLSVIALGYGLDDWGFESGRCWKFFSSPPCPDRFWGPPSLLSNEYQGALSLGVKRPEREAGHSPPSSAEVKNVWSYTSTPQYTFIAWCSVKAQRWLLLTYFVHIIIKVQMNCILWKLRRQIMKQYTN